MAHRFSGASTAFGGAPNEMATLEERLRSIGAALARPAATAASDGR